MTNIALKNDRSVRGATSVGASLTSERLKDDDIQASRLEETRVRERTLENRRGRGDRSEGGEESLKSAGLLLFRNTFFPSGKMVGAVWVGQALRIR